eukprot:scaffold2507_cov122-Isochrysis_galbana.AAC.3
MSRIGAVPSDGERSKKSASEWVSGMRVEEGAACVQEGVRWRRAGDNLNATRPPTRSQSLGGSSRPSPQPPFTPTPADVYLRAQLLREWRARTWNSAGPTPR